MDDDPIVIRNVYVMMAYAFRAIRSEGTTNIRGESFDSLHDLLGEILIRGVGTQVKRGLHRDYVEHSDEMPTIRGRIDVTSTISSLSSVRGRLVCKFDDYEPDTPHNRALKSVIVLLIRHGNVHPDRRDRLRRVLPYLHAVTLIPPTSIRWNALTIHRSNASYRLLLGACELIVRGLLPTQDSGDIKLSAWISDEAMSSLYERFLREYYRFHYPELTPKASTVEWDYRLLGALGDDQLPAMRTDISLFRGHRMLIIDAKYYSSSMQVSQWGKHTIHSGNLYQLFSYVKNADVMGDGRVSGMLLYARTTSDRQPELDIVAQGNRLGSRTLDLNQPWEHLAAQLNDAVRWLDY